MQTVDKIRYTFTANMWQHHAAGGWFFISLPQAMSCEIRTHLHGQEEGWGRMKATAQIDDHVWDTAIWFDTAANTYLLPIKAQVRKKANLQPQTPVTCTIYL